MAEAIVLARQSGMLDESVYLIRFTTDTSSPSTTSPQLSDDDIDHECKASTSNTAQSANGKLGMATYLAYEPVVESAARQTWTDFRRYDPPAELLHIPDITLEEIKAVIKPSIKRIKARQTEEQDVRIAQARAPRPLARGRRASVKPGMRAQRTSGALHPLDIPVEVRDSGMRLSAGSAGSSPYGDSGYASQSQSPSPSSAMARSHSPLSAIKGKGRSFGLHAFFGRSHRSSVSSERPVIESSSTASVSSSEMSISVPSTPRPITLPATVECTACQEDFAPSEVIRVTCHPYCKDCFVGLITNAVENESAWPAKCCLNPIPSPLILSYITSSLCTKFLSRTAEWAVSVADRIYCSRASCASFIPPTSITPSTYTAVCLACTQQTCTTCRGRSHGTSDCPIDPALLETIALGEREGWKRCYQCHAMIELTHGCMHMVCACKAQFCFACERKWNSVDHEHCNEQWRAIQTRMQTRRRAREAETVRQGLERAVAEAREARQRRAREEAAEEERVNVQLVADFMALEAERERVALEALMRQEELEREARAVARRVAEERRLQMVSARFEILRSEMEALHDVQRVLLAERHEFEKNRDAQNLVDDLAALSLRHQTEVVKLKVSSSTAIQLRKTKFAKEYNTRHAKELKMEEQRTSDVRAYWDQEGALDMEVKVMEDRNEGRRQQNDEYERWDKGCRAQMWELEDREKTKMRDLVDKHEAETKEIKGRAEIDKVEWGKVVEAEEKWIREVVSERAEMLGNEERRMYNGGD